MGSWRGLDAGPLPVLQLALDCNAALLKLGLNSAVICMPAVCTSQTWEGKQSALILRFAMPGRVVPVGDGRRGTAFVVGLFCLRTLRSCAGRRRTDRPHLRLRRDCTCFGGCALVFDKRSGEPHRLRLWLPTPRDGKEHTELQPAAEYWRRLTFDMRGAWRP